MDNQTTITQPHSVSASLTERSLMSHVSNNILRKISDKFVKSDEKNFSDESLRQLYGIFGQVFERALELHELGRVTKIYPQSVNGVNSKDKEERVSRWLLQVRGTSGEIYNIFPEVNYCNCAAFRFHVLNDQQAYTCKHVLAGWLSSLDDRKLNRQEVAASVFRDLLRYQVTK